MRQNIQSVTERQPGAGSATTHPMVDTTISQDNLAAGGTVIDDTFVDTHLAELEADFGEYEQGYLEDGSPLPLEPGEPSDMKASERLEAFINKMMQKAELLNTTREEQIVKKQQILEELQKVEQELQEKAKAQLLLNAQEKAKQKQQEGGWEGVEQYKTVPSLQEQSAAVACAQGPLPLHVALKKQLLEAQKLAAAKQKMIVDEASKAEPEDIEKDANGKKEEQYEEEKEEDEQAESEGATGEGKIPKGC